jgi:hypothetical protein
MKFLLLARMLAFVWAILLLRPHVAGAQPVKWKYGIKCGEENLFSTGPDGTVYASSNFTCAINTTGGLKWMYFTGAYSLPMLGPDGTAPTPNNNTTYAY